MFRSMTPKQAMRLATRSSLIMAGVTRAVAQRVAGMLGGWTVSADEDSRRINDKPGAILAAGPAMMQATARGGSAGAVALAGVTPIRTHTNRLTKAGPKLPRTP